MNKQLENKIGHQKREIAALTDKVARLEKHCLELQHQNAEYKHANDKAFGYWEELSRERRDIAR